MFCRIRLSGNVAILIIAVVAAMTFLQPSAAAQPAQPLVYLDTTYVPPTGQTISVPSGGDFQAALNNAQPGDTISLQAGATFTGNFVLPNKGGTNWIVIRSSAPDSSLPPAGSRITPAYSGVLPKIVTPNTSPAVTTDLGANHYRFIGVEITTTHSDTLSTVYNLAWLEYNGGQTSLSQMPTDIIFDRCYIHGTPTGNVRRGLLFNGARMAVIDSYLSDFHEVGQDAQAILGYNGPGPFKITNNYLEASGENVMFGGSDPSIANLVPSDIEIRSNHFYKPLTWRVGDPSYAGIHWSIKNIFELKNAQRVLIDGNIFENNWADAQAGFAIQWTPRNADGTAPWSVVQDVTFTNNIVRHSGSAVNLLGQDYFYPSQQMKRVLIKNNLFEDISGATWGGNGILYQFLSGTADVVIDHNTMFQDGPFIFADGAVNTGFVYQNNIAPNNLYGVGGSGTTPDALLTLSTYFPGYLFARNVIAGGNPSSYPPNNFFPASLNDVGFVNLVGGDYHLSLSSPYNNAATDGTDVGVDFDALLLATQGVIDGSTVAPPPDTTPPVISAVSTPLISSSGATVSWTTNEASDSQVEYGLTTAYGSSTALNTSLVTSHSQSLSGLNAATLYHYRVKSRDAAGNLAVSGDFTFTTLAPADLTPPTVSMTAPASGSTVSGTITVSASASDNVGVAGVQFKLDGVNLGTEVVAAPYSVSWNTAAAANGSHTLTAVARDAAGNTTTSTAVTVMVSNNAAVSVNPPVIFTDDPFAQDTPIKAVHITELRQAVNTLRSSNGLLAFSFTDSTLGNATTQVRAVHITELRTALDGVYDAKAKAKPTYTDPMITAGQTTIKKAHIAEIRQAVKDVE